MPRSCKLISASTSRLKDVLNCIFGALSMAISRCSPLKKLLSLGGVAVALLKEASSGPTSAFALKTTREMVSVPERMLLLLVPLPLNSRAPSVRNWH